MGKATTVYSWGIEGEFGLWPETREFRREAIKYIETEIGLGWKAIKKQYGMSVVKVEIRKVVPAEK
jgi:hypothetical protein